MSALDRATKALEALKVIQPTTHGDPQKKKESITKREKIVHCTTIADVICSHNLRTIPDFPKILGFAVETFLFCCDDDDSNVRIIADECLNRTIKSLLDSHLNRLQVELYKEIKKNGPSRCLRAALSRFADLCHLIRPEKFRPFAVNLLPCLVKISRRANEELVQETLAAAIAKVMPVLGQFTNDKEIKMLLKAFLLNIPHSSAVVRRSAASSLLAVCQYSRRPKLFYCWLLGSLFDLILPVQDSQPVSCVLGVLLCLRHLVPHLKEICASNSDLAHTNNVHEDVAITCEHLFKIYEITLYFACHPDHNVVTSTLDTLCQLLKMAPKTFQNALLSPVAITDSVLHATELNKLNRSHSESQSSVIEMPSIGDESALEDTSDAFFIESSDVRSAVTLESSQVFVDGDDYEPYEDPDQDVWEDQDPNQSPSFKLEFNVGNIGSFTDVDIPLKYCVRLICSSFLLNGTPGKGIPDENVRVSVKSLAFSCLSPIFSFYPQALLLDLLLPNEEMPANRQKICDIIMYIKHPDPYLKGQCALTLGNFIHNALKESCGFWDIWKGQMHPEFSLEALLSKVTSLVMDSSYVAARLGLTGLKYCLNTVLHSMHGPSALPILDTLFCIKKSTYWLTKVELLNFVSQLSFKAISYLETKANHYVLPFQNENLQCKILRDIFIPLLGDEDYRVRQAASTAFVKIVPNLFFPADHPYQDVTISIAKENTKIFLDFKQYFPSHSTLPLVHALIKPFNSEESSAYCIHSENVLTRVLSFLLSSLRSCTNRHLINGCCQTLCMLSETFLVTIYSRAWEVTYSEELSLVKTTSTSQSSSSNTPKSAPLNRCSDLLSYLIEILTHTTVALDISTHQHALQLSGNLLCGMWYQSLQEHQKSSETAANDNKKRCFVNCMKEQLFRHVMKILNIYCHIVNEQSPVTASARPTLPSLPNAPSLSPIKRKKGKSEPLLVTSNLQKGSPIKLPPDKSDIEKEKSSSKQMGSIGQFHSSPLYMKVYGNIEGAYATYKLSVDFQGSEKLHHLLKCALNALSQILEVSDMQEMGKHADEILNYLKCVMLLEPCSSVQCVRQLLKSLFGTNLHALYQEAQIVDIPSSNLSAGHSPSVSHGLYHYCITAPYTNFTCSLTNKNIKTGYGDRDDLVSSFNFIKLSDKLTTLLKSGTKGVKANLAAHIKLFEGVVIKALKLYTITSNVTLQCQVLDLLAQLVQLRVNYCLLDSDQIFIGFILKQFEFIEEGQISHVDLLIPRIFYFLVLLSYERYHSKSIISVPKILQLCDGLIASGQPPDMYVIRALQPLIEDLFLVRGSNKVDSCKELDAQREVVASMLFKLINYPQVSELFIIIVCQAFKESEEKWRKLSRQIVDAILPLLARQQLYVDNQTDLNTLHRLLEAVASNVFRPVDILLKALFTQPKSLDCYPHLQRWLCMVLALLRVIIIQSKEEVFLSRLNDMHLTVNVYKLKHIPVTMSPDTIVPIDPDTDFETQTHASGVMFSRFLFQVVGVAVESVCSNLHSIDLHSPQQKFLCQQLAHALLYLMHIFQSGTFRKVTSCAMEIAKNESSTACTKQSAFPYYFISEIHDMFLKLSSFYPTLVVQWCNILSLLNCGCQSIWSQVLLPNSLERIAPDSISIKSEKQSSNVFIPCNVEIVRRAGVILLCDYVCENSNDVELMTFLIVNHVNDLVSLCVETTVQEFLSAIHRNAAASGLFIEAVSARCRNFNSATFFKRAINCLEAVHRSQSSNLLRLLIENFLLSHYVVVARNCDRLACSRIEILLSDPFSVQLSVDEVNKMIDIVDSSTVKKRHQRLLSLLHRLKIHLSEANFQNIPVNFQKLDLNKDWFLKYIKDICLVAEPPVKECALLLSNLKGEDVLGILSSKEISLSVIEMCLKVGAEMMSSENVSSIKSNDPFWGIKNASECPLYRAARSALLLHLTNFIAELPLSSKYEDRLKNQFTHEYFWRTLCDTTSATSCYLRTLNSLCGQSIPSESMEDIAHLAIICCKAVTQMMTVKKLCNVPSKVLYISLQLLNDTLQNSSLFSLISSPRNSSWMFSAINSVHQLISYIHAESGLLTAPFAPLPEEIKHAQEDLLARKACVQAAEIVAWLESSRKLQSVVPQFIFDLLEDITIGLSRYVIVDSYARTPPVLWQLGWTPTFTGEYQTIVPPPPGEYLQDRDVLKQYIYRINLLGWISRQQFEETWMALLGVLSATPIDGVEGKEEDQERIQTSCLAVKSITSLLLQTLLLPEPGNPQKSYFLVQPRDKPLAFLYTKCGKKLLRVRSIVHKNLQEILHQKRNDDQIFNLNAERVSGTKHYSLSQVSLEYLTAAAGYLEDTDDPDESASSNSSPLSSNVGGAASYQQREQSLASASLDIHSCLHFLLDLYNQWLSSVSCPFTPITLLTEVVRSVVILSDIFMERAQFEWMLDALLEVQRVHPAEDEIIAQYLIFGICKAAAVLDIESDMLEKLKGLIELNCKSIFLPTQICTLHGLMFLLEQRGKEDSFPLLSTASDYLLKPLCSIESSKLHSQHVEDHMLIMWAVAMYMIENYQEDEISDFSQKIIQQSLVICGNCEDVSTSVYLTILHGLERLLVAGILLPKDIDILLKLTADRVKSSGPLHSLPALAVLLSCMYIGKSSNLWCTEDIVMEKIKITDETDISVKSLQGDNLMALERTTILFERVKKSYPFEAEIICQILPSFLVEFFPMQDILNKIIGEYLSSQQPHHQFIASVIHEVFQYLHMHSNEEVIQDWVMLSLSNFTQKSPLSMAVWCLTCFFVSGTSNVWLQSIFPHVRNRVGKLDDKDKTLFTLSGIDFWNQLKNEEHKQAYYNIMKSVAHTHTPYVELLNSL